ncbi:NHLP bacteriocin export ABC transporter permease/ATPase subunit [Oscillatoria sp. CS-180]|uniref:NHLP bacteriocin export ABC transporter permease/ATPase subunit n=1 Tax=Oscillatoria sp. CS-180 TaxID=3021720 RepID=UPI00232C6D30|nr:NHLP bacteriocin export ABC transporter permease/ATPase subunit [Oscillatoria sp. CS-180]MDB9524591.1 NHLP bacteriocin export ABC transporter permease/ATPase subunit [Oscillatoria sp. CS-180]
MSPLDVPTSTLTLHGNQPLLLQDPHAVWCVKSGSLALFAVQVDEQQEPISQRRYLFTVYAGEWIVGTGLWTGVEANYAIAAVAYETSTLEPFAITDLITAAIAGEAIAITGLETWILHFSARLAEHPLDIMPKGYEIVFTKRSRYLSLQHHQVLTPGRNQVNWIRVLKGHTEWLGLDGLKVEAAGSAFPVTADLWLQAQVPAELEILTLGDDLYLNTLTVDDLLAGVAQFHRHIFQYLEQLEHQTITLEFQQFRERQQLTQQAATGAMGELSGVLNAKVVTVPQVGTALLVAAGAVGRIMDLEVKPPTASIDLEHVQEPIDAIASASKFRIRRVLLTGNWWTREQGPLLTYTAEGEPCALLPEGRKRYVLFDPVTRSKTPVDEAVVDTLSVEAYMFYRPLPEKINQAFEILQFAVQGHIWDIAWIVGLGVIGSLLGMVVPQATSLLVSDAIPAGDRALLLQLGLALIVAAIAKTIFEFAQGLVSLRVETAADSTLQPAVWDRLLQLHPSFFRNYATGDLLLRLLSVSQIRRQLSGATQQSLLNGVFALLNLGLMLIYSVKLAIVAIGITVVTTGITLFTSLKLVKKARKQEVLDGEINSLNVELINGVAKLRVAAAEERALGAWAQIFAQRTRLTASIQRLNDSIAVLTEALPLLSSVLIFWFAILALQNAQTEGRVGLTVGTFLAFNAAYGTFLGGVTSLGNTVTDILGIVPLWERAEVIVKGTPENDSSKTDPGRLTGQLSLDHVTFRYREEGPLILDDVSIYAEPGEFIALVGPSGSGKSTVFRMLLGFETPPTGTVYYDGQDLLGLDVQAVRRQLGVVLQNGRIGAGSLVDNITGGALVSLDEAWEAATSSGLADDIRQMPMGMHTIISEGGSNLSGGQRQRLLIARAIVLKPNIILLDEATSALDNRTQNIVTESLDRLNATRVVIAHRLSTIRNADRIYVVQAGRVVQTGTFDELVEQDGLFATLAARQLD